MGMFGEYFHLGIFLRASALFQRCGRAALCRCVLWLPVCAVLFLLPGNAVATKGDVEIGAGETRTISDLLHANPTLKLGNIQFTSKNSSSPGTLRIDVPANLKGHLSVSKKRYGKISVDGGQTLTLENMSSRGEWFVGNVANLGENFSFDGEGDLVFQENYLTGDGGVFYAEGTLSFGADALFKNNTVNIRRANKSNRPNFGSGGAIYADDELRFNGQTTFTGNIANGGDGGAVYGKKNVIFGNGAELSHNKSVRTPAPNGLSYIGNGGGVYSRQDIVFGNNAFLEYNEGASGGAVYSTKDGTLRLNSAKVVFGHHAWLGYNKALGHWDDHRGVPSGYGGAVRAEDSVKFGDNAVLEGNTAVKTGGAVHGEKEITFGRGAALSGNSATHDGGALYSKSSVRFGGTAAVAGNSVQGQGGAIWAAKDVTLGDSAAFTNNTAPGGGGGIYSQKGAVNFGAWAELADNTASAGSGGAVWAQQNVTLDDRAVFRGNSSRDKGGAVYSDKGSVSFADGAVLDANTAGVDGGGIWAKNGSVIFGSGAILTDNTADGSGGGIWAEKYPVIFGDNATLSGNTAGGFGGGIAMQGALSVMFGDNAMLSGNTAGAFGGALSGHDALFMGSAVLERNHAHFGGALYTAQLASFAGDAYLAMNSADTLGGALYGQRITFSDGAALVGNSAGVQGGAIYAANVSLNARANDILFSGNTAAGLPNAIHLYSSSPQLTFNAGAGRRINMEDPVTADSNSLVFAEINTLESSTGRVRFAGHASTLHAITNVYRGTFELADGASYGSDTSQFILQPGATLVSGGGSAVNGKFLLQGGSRLSFDLSGLAPDSATPALSVSSPGAAYVSGLVDLDLLSLNRTGTYTLVRNWGASTNFSNSITVRGQDIGAIDRLRGLVSHSLSGKDLVLHLGTVNNLALTWTGNVPNWNVTAKDAWKSVDVSRHFLHGDSVTFTAAAPEKNVLVDQNGVVVADMTVTGGEYAFSGGPIIADKNASTLNTASGKLAVSAGSRVDFTGISGTNAFAGIDLAGTLELGQSGHLGADLADVNFSGTAPGLIFNGGSFFFTGKGGDRNRAVYDPSGAGLLSFETKNNADLAFFNSAAPGHGGAVYAGPDGSLAFGDGTAFALNRAGADGGAVYAGRNAAFGASVLFRENTAVDDGGGVYAGTAIDVGSGAVFRENAAGRDGGGVYGNTVTFAGDATFDGNTAGGDGGGVYGKTVTFADGATFLNNSANGRGGAIRAETGLNLTAQNHDVLFSGNTAAGKPEAVSMAIGAGAGAPNLTMNAAAGRFITFEDPVNSDSGSGLVTVTINKNTGSDGTVRFSGNRSDIAAKTTVTQGTFELADGAHWGRNATDTSFTLGKNATLRITGNKQLTISAYGVQFNGILEFDPASWVGTDPVLTLDSTSVSPADGLQVHISSLVRRKNAALDLVYGDNADFSCLGDVNLYYKGARVIDTRLNGILQLDAKSDSKRATLRQTRDIVNLGLTWTGNLSDAWNFSVKNWKETDGLSQERLFLDGDAVVFDATGVEKNVVVSDYGAAVASMAVVSGHYSFNGGDIESSTGSSLTGTAAATERLDVYPGASAEFSNNLSFRNGYAIYPGAQLRYKGSSIHGSIANDGDVIFDVSETVPLVYADGIGGSGQLTKTGPGRLEVGGIVEQGGFRVEQGTFAFADSSTRVITRSGFAVQSRGTLETGKGGQIVGDLRMAAEAGLELAGEEVLFVSGTADISDAIKAKLTWEGWEIGRIYPVLKAGALARPFTARELDWTQGTGTLMRNGSYLLFLTGNPEDLWPKGDTYNQRSTLRGLAGLPGESPLRELLLLGEERASAAADMLSGEGHVSTRTGLMQRMRAEPFKIGARLSAASLQRDDASSLRAFLTGEHPSAMETRSGSSLTASGFASAFSSVPASFSPYGVWVEGGGVHATSRSNGNAAKARLYGPEVAAGMDLRLSGDWLFGVSFRASDLTSKVADRDYEATVKTLGATLYGGREVPAGPGTARFIAGAGYAHHHVTSERGTGGVISGVDELESTYDAHSWQVFGEAAYALKPWRDVLVEPYANLSYDALHTESFTEDGGLGSLRSDSDTTENAATLLGVRGGMRLHERVMLKGNLGWLHVFGDLDPKARHQFRDGGSSFSVKGVTTEKDTVVVGAGAALDLGGNVTLSLSYDGMFGGKTTDHSGMIRLGWEW